MVIESWTPLYMCYCCTTASTISKMRLGYIFSYIIIEKNYVLYLCILQNVARFVGMGMVPSDGF